MQSGKAGAKTVLGSWSQEARLTHWPHFLLPVEPWVLLGSQFAYQWKASNNSHPTRVIKDVKAILKYQRSLGFCLGNDDVNYILG